MWSSRCCLLICAVITLTGCLAAPKAAPPTAVNAGVDIVAPAVLASATMRPSSLPTRVDQQDLVNIISGSDQPHQRLLEVLRVSGYVPKLQEAGPYTIFAPTDDAFSKLPPGVIEKLLQPSRHAELVNFVRYHLLSGRIGISDLQQTNGLVPTLLPKSNLIVRGIDNKVMVNDANVIRTDTSACNGVVQWVDGVLLPPSS